MKPGRRLFFCGAITLAIAATAMAQTEPVLPADPLTTLERDASVRIATDEGIARGLLQPGQFSLVGVELLVYKSDGGTIEPVPDLSMRHSAVLFYRSNSNDGLHALIDFRNGRSRELVVIPGESVPVGKIEVERAAELALASEEVRRVLGPAASAFRVGLPQSDAESTIQGLRVLGSGPEDPCSRQRCVELFFRSGGHFIAGSRVTVNLSTSTVRVENTPL